MGDIFYNLLAVNNLKFICKNITANRIGLQQNILCILHIK